MLKSIQYHDFWLRLAWYQGQCYGYNPVIIIAVKLIPCHKPTWNIYIVEYISAIVHKRVSFNVGLKYISFMQ